MISIPLHLLNADERHGAELVLDHLRRHARQMKERSRAATFRHLERQTILTGANAIAAAADIARRELTPELRPHDYQPFAPHESPLPARARRKAARAD